MRLSDRKDGPGPARTSGAQSARCNQDGGRARKPPRAGSLDARLGCGGSSPRSRDGNSTRSDSPGLRRYAAHLSDDVRSAENCGAVIHERRFEIELLRGINAPARASRISDGANIMKTKLIAATALLLSFSTSAVAGDLNRLLSVKGMTCPACSAKVEHALTGVSGVKTAEVDLKSGQAKVIADPRVKPAELVNAVQKAGFQAEVSNPAPASRASDACCH